MQPPPTQVFQSQDLLTLVVAFCPREAMLVSRTLSGAARERVALLWRRVVGRLRRFKHTRFAWHVVELLWSSRRQLSMWWTETCPE